MKYSEILESLKSCLTIRYHEKKTYQKKVADALGVTIPMVRRRLAGKTFFTSEEISVICEKLEIPVDEVFYSCGSRTKRPFEFFQYDFSGYEHESNKAFDQSIEMLLWAARSEHSRLYISCNTLPNILNPTFEWLARFAAFQWIFFVKGSGALPALSDMVLPAQLQQRLDRYLLAVRALKKSICLVSDKIIENYFTEVRRFYVLEYIHKEEARQLVADVEGALKLFENVCTEGYLENGKEMEIYCTDSFFPNDMYIIESEQIHFALLQPNPVNPILTKSPDVCQTMTQWFKLWKRSSTLISQSGAHIRRQFMERQYQALNEFKEYIGI